MPIVVVGSVAYDGVETPHGKIDRMLGGACTYIALAASYFNPVKIVAVVGEDYARTEAGLLATALRCVQAEKAFEQGVDTLTDRARCVTIDHRGLGLIDRAGVGKGFIAVG